MDTFIIFRNLTQSEVDTIAKQPNPKVWVSNEVDTSLFPFAWQSIDLDHNWMELASNIVKTFPHRLYGGKKLVEYLNYDSSYLFFHTRFFFFNRFFLAHKEAATVEELIKESSIDDSIYVAGTSPYLKDFEFSRNVNVMPGSSTLAKIPKLRFAILSALRTLIAFTQVRKYKQAKHLFLNPPVKLVPIIDKTTLKLRPGNPPVEYYLDDFLKRKDAFVLEEFYPLREIDYSFSRSNLLGVFPKKTIFLEPFLIRALFKPGTWRDQKAYAKKEMDLFNLVNTEEKDPIIKLANKINFDLKSLRKLSVLRINAGRIFFNKKMKSFGCIDEHSQRVKSLLEPAAEKGLMTYAIQHGSIHKYHHSYIYLKEDHNYLYTPDKTFTFGTQATDVLINHGNFAKSKIEVSGQIRTDIIPILNNSNQASKQLNLPLGKPLVLYASQPVSDPKQRDLLNIDFFKLSKDFPQYHFVLKPHPREIDHQYFHDIAKSVGTTNYQILNEDLYLLLSQCSILLTFFSTVGAEAIYFGKPLLVLDYDNMDTVDYIKEGVGIPATNYTETKNAFEKMMTGELRCDPNACENYRQKYTGTIDGKVSKRILNAVTA